MNYKYSVLAKYLVVNVYRKSDRFKGFHVRQMRMKGGQKNGIPKNNIVPERNQ